MKKNISILLAMLLAIIFKIPAYGQLCNAHTVSMSEDGTCDYNPLILVFQDNFDGNTLDLTKWNAINTVVRDQVHAHEKQWYTPSNLEVSNGTLKIITKKETTPVYTYVIDGQQISESFDYTSGEIDSKYQFGYGYYEIRCKIPKGKGFWPAFWGYAYGISYDEIDVFEFSNSTDIFGSYDASLLSKVHQMTPHRNNLSCPTHYTGTDFSADFHTFGVYRDGYIIQWYVDGVLKRTDSQFYTLLTQNVDCSTLKAGEAYMSNEAFPRDPMTIIANLAIQNGSDLPDASTPFPSQYEIDYIRVYKRLPCATAAVTISSSSLDSYYFGTTVATSGPVPLASGRQLTLVGQDKVILNPGFNGNAGCNFVGSIQPCGGIINRMAAADIQIGSTDNSNDPVSSNALENSINFFPNPTSGKLNFEVNLKEEKTVEISILSPLGKEILKKDLGKINTTYNEIDMGNQPDGIYLIRIKSDNDIAYKKIILSK